MAITGTLEDREEVRVLHARYCLSIDGGRYDEGDFTPIDTTLRLRYISAHDDAQ